jgi:hypothetical protein
MSKDEICAIAPVVNPSKPTGEQLSSWIHGDDASLHWASGRGGDYVVTCHREYWGGNNWNAEHQRGRRRQQLGTAATVEQAKALTQRDYDLATERRS